jgi:hypothetical protein
LHHDGRKKSPRFQDLTRLNDAGMDLLSELDVENEEAICVELGSVENMIAYI